MSYFPGLKLTKLGEQLLAKAQGNLSETITFTRAELGSGEITTDDEIRFLTSLKAKWKDVTISDIKRVGEDENQVQIELQFSNGDLEENKIFRELGLYAKSKNNTEVLFAYTNAKENYDYIPVTSDNPQSFIINILIAITSNTKVDANIDLNSYVSLRKFEEEIEKLNDELNKIASESELGRVKIGETIYISEDGTIDINPQVTTPQEMTALVDKYKAKEE